MRNNFQWATYTKRSHDQIKQLSKNKAQKWKENLYLFKLVELQIFNFNTQHNKNDNKFLKIRWVQTMWNSVML